MLKDVSVALALNQMEADQYQKIGIAKEKIKIVPNGVDLSEYDNLPEKGEFRRKYNIRDDERVILFLGRIDKIKGIDLLVDAFWKVSGDLNNLKLVIVGPDYGILEDIKKKAEELIELEKILFTGPLYGNDKWSSYLDADVYVLPSSYETFPITVLEAAACGKPVIVTDRCGISDIVKDNFGLVVDYNAADLKKALLIILTDQKLKKRFEKNASLMVKQEFNWERISEKVERIYLEMVDK
jgi:glycosyltransferase involved in cell wall biosynthesis